MQVLCHKNMGWKSRFACFSRYLAAKSTNAEVKFAKLTGVASICARAHDKLRPSQ
jgi:hypothetical protein